MVTITVTIDTEEDDWGSYAREGATAENIRLLPWLQEHFDRFGVRPTYLVNRPPLLDARSVEVLGHLAERPDIEIGTHCHPWNTPPFTPRDRRTSMMCNLPVEVNRGKIREMTGLIERKLGVRSRTFRAGRWGFGPTVAEALHAEGYAIDASVSPLIDWSPIGGADFSDAPLLPYRCHPRRPLTPDPTGPLLELPTTVSFLRGDPKRLGQLRHRLEESFVSRLKLVGFLDRTGILTRRWLSPELSTGSEMIRLAEAATRRGVEFLSLIFHSSTLLPGATPFVMDEHQQERFLRDLNTFLAFCQQSGFVFKTLLEAAEDLGVTNPPS